MVQHCRSECSHKQELSHSFKCLQTVSGQRDKYRNVIGTSSWTYTVVAWEVVRNRTDGMVEKLLVFRKWGL
jgi:hypothetical protein